MITLTENAQNAVQRFISKSEKSIGGLRISVTGGGCSGMVYAMALEPAAHEDDAVVHCGATAVFVDPASATLLAGATVDFTESVSGSGFTFDNPNAHATCDCGKSFAG